MALTLLAVYTTYTVGISAMYAGIVLVAAVSLYYAYRIYRLTGRQGGRDILLTFGAFLVATTAASVFEILETLGFGASLWLEVTYLMATVASLSLFLVLSFDVKDGNV